MAKYEKKVIMVTDRGFYIWIKNAGPLGNNYFYINLLSFLLLGLLNFDVKFDTVMLRINARGVY